MAVRASVSQAQTSTGVIFAFVIALLAALLLGGAGGYLIRGLAAPASSTTTTYTAPHPFVVEPAPYQTPRPSPIQEPIRDPSGGIVPI